MKYLLAVLIIIAVVLLITVVLGKKKSYAGEVILAWDANEEKILKGYKLFYGASSRFGLVGQIQAWCAAHAAINEPRNTKCEQEWQDICKPSGAGDVACHPMLFSYDTVVNVKNVTEYTLEGLEEGRKYFFALTTYDGDKDHEQSRYSEELTHLVEYARPGGPGGIEKRDPAPARMSFPKTLDSIKEMIEQKGLSQEEP